MNGRTLDRSALKAHVKHEMVKLLTGQREPTSSLEPSPPPPPVAAPPRSTQAHMSQNPWPQPHPRPDPHAVTEAWPSAAHLSHSLRHSLPVFFNAAATEALGESASSSRAELVERETASMGAEAG